MKYKVGDKVRVRKDLVRGKCYDGKTAVSDMANMRGMTVTIGDVGESSYGIEEDPHGYMWTDEMFEPVEELTVEEELTAEEAIRLYGEICRSTVGSCFKCPVSCLNNGNNLTCTEFIKTHPGKAVEILKQYKKDHEKKEIEVVQKIYCLVIDEKRTVVHEEKIDKSDSCEDVLKNYCENHDGKFFSLMEFRYEVK